MTENKQLYIASMGAITAIGATLEKTSAAFNAEISGYAVSDFYTNDNEAITMALVPESVFSESGIHLEQDDRHNDCHDRITKMAIIAIDEACSSLTDEQAIPLVVASSDKFGDTEGLTPLIVDLENYCQPWVTSDRYRKILGDRAIGIDAIEFIFRHIDQIHANYVLVGSSDSHYEQDRLDNLDSDNRLLTANSVDGFAPGEAASFLLLTPQMELAMERDGHVIALNMPGLAQEPGHLGSDEAYLGEGLDQAFKKVLTNFPASKIDTIYSSMNGEHHWAKEYGVAYIRNQHAFADQVNLVHPGDQLGDTGTASGPLMIAMAADKLFRQNQSKAHLVYSSSDSALRGAVVLEKIATMTTNPGTGI